MQVLAKYKCLPINLSFCNLIFSTERGGPLKFLLKGS